MDEQPPQFPHSPSEQPPPLSATGKGGRSRAFLVLFIIACALLGMALSWGMRQRALASRLLGKADAMRTQLALSAAGDSDLAMLMTGESSERVVLRPQSPEARGHAALIWDPKLGKGMLFCQELWPAEAGERYHLWLGSAESGDAGLTRVAGFDAQADSTVVRFHAPEMNTPVRFVISAEADGEREAPGKVLFAGRGP